MLKGLDRQMRDAVYLALAAEVLREYKETDLADQLEIVALGIQNKELEPAT